MSEFIQRHIGPTPEEQSKMLDDLGVSTIDELSKTNRSRFNFTSW
ncbi:MAG: hypothetical protein CM15mL5_1030 [uncultured marine virus]|nr:MAG: hypothetical protein CM15mL5_1030 [uncultured marine virus]